MSDPIHVILLSGGSGTRLWPLSNVARSKQFLKVLRDDENRPESMVQRTVRLVREQCPSAQVTVATSAAQVGELKRQVDESFGLSLEPERRDTAPAIMLAAAQVAWSQGASREATVVVMPIDTYADPAYYQSVLGLDAAVRAHVADLVLLGVEPLEPSSKYGYIVPDAAAELPAEAPAGASRVARFVEKPAHDVACDLIDHGALWNCGVFAFRLGYLLDVVSAYSDAQSYEELRDRYCELPKNSFDYEVVEKAKSVAVIRYAGAWKDLGTWGALTEELADQVSEGVWLDEETAEDVHAINETDVPLIVAGVSHAAVVATADGILVAGKDADSRVRDLVSKAALAEPRCEHVAWGSYRVLRRATCSDGASVRIREFVLETDRDLHEVTYAGEGASWTVIEGNGEVLIDGEAHALRVGTTLHIRPDVRVSVRAALDLHVVEVWRGPANCEEALVSIGEA